MLGCTSVPFPVLSEQLYGPWRRFLYTKVQHGLLMSAWVLLAPELEQEQRDLRKHRLRLMHLGVAPRTQRDHQMQHRSPRLAMVDGNGSFVPARSPADAAAAAIPLQDDLSQAAEVRLIPPAQRVAGRAHAIGEDLCRPQRQ